MRRIAAITRNPLVVALFLALAVVGGDKVQHERRVLEVVAPQWPDLSVVEQTSTSTPTLTHLVAAAHVPQREGERGVLHGLHVEAATG